MSKLGDNLRTHLKIYGPAALLVIAGFVIALQFVQPAPPSTIRMATGDIQGAYHSVAQRYQRYFHSQGIQLDLINTAGSLENLTLLGKGEVDLAFVQGGTRSAKDPANLAALGSLYFEPLWLFHQQSLKISRFKDIQEKHIAIGPSASGTYALVNRFLTENGITLNAQVDSSMEPSAAAAALLSAQLDAAFFVSGPKSKLIQQLLNASSLRLASMDRAKAYAQRNRFLHQLLLPEGAMDLQRNIPQHDTQLIATTANLVGTTELHPAIVTLMLQAATKMHSEGGWFEEKDQFPSSAYQEFALHEEAERYFKNGPPFLQRYLPFWAASLFDRVKVMLLPLVVLLLPLFKVMPPLYQWRMKRKVYRWYDELEVLDYQLNTENASAHPELLSKLRALDDEVRKIKVPASFSNNLYQLRLHIDMVAKKNRDYDLLNTRD